MPVSRKRKSTKSKPPKHAPRSRAIEGRHPLDDQRVVRVTPAVKTLVAQLVDEIATLPDAPALEDRLCALIGPVIHAFEEEPLEAYAGPQHVMEALIKAAASVDGDTGRRIFAAVAAIAPARFHGQIKKARRQNPVPSAQPAGDVRWVRDRYGSRFGILAPFTVPGGDLRWYLWDVDACGLSISTVHSGFHAGPDEALAAWHAGVGPFAAADAPWSPIDDAEILDEVLPRDRGAIRMGGESAAQFTEFHRGLRLAETVRDLRGPVRRTWPELGPETAADEFAAWLRARRPDALPDDLDELATDFAESWQTDATRLYGTFSAHRVARNVLLLRDYFQEPGASELVALIPDWVTWLGERAGADADLVEHSLAYRPPAGDALSHQARVIE
ncbi:hypothetical protein [Catenuloplanes japonicus]|uniref:hypothetical protein n=1 Tax=Catenuloplanes japonicus TaxID=33876 RepID=UPI0005245ADF|nr:hypothetical protein [Catenuloplanes japonicus]